MWRIFVLIISLIAHADSILPRSRPYSAASPAQIRFAIENKYDDTGPGAKSPEYAYQTYKTLEEALVSYYDDPDTKLPEAEKQKAYSILQGSEPINYGPPIRQLPKTVEEYTGYNEANVKEETLNQYNRPNQPIFYREPNTNYKYVDLRGLPLRDVPPKKFLNEKLNNNVFSYHKVQALKSNPISLAHYARNPEVIETEHQFDPNPRYSFSYGVHDKHTGDSKSAHEIRDGGNVRGYYSFVDSDGKQRTVHYTADDKLGFRADVQRT
ncbi:uncharacterized protein LOC124535462 [Vanessa cardui]|uniref:uncharacterized protein LOC124535462 n=1 Tax=Vanessa cardui TaxID=171605 RepID=UPI001F13CF34|nr:uncharacterized protein LOC124535462 [Vanessa cardui]